MKIHNSRADILASACRPDFFEQSGFKYDEGTFDALFCRKFNDGVDVSTESSDEADEEAMMLS